MKRIIYNIIVWAVSYQTDLDKKNKSLVEVDTPRPSNPEEMPVRRYEINEMHGRVSTIQKKLNSLITHLGITFENKGLTARPMTDDEKRRAERYPDAEPCNTVSSESAGLRY